MDIRNPLRSLHMNHTVQKREETALTVNCLRRRVSPRSAAPRRRPRVNGAGSGVRIAARRNRQSRQTVRAVPLLLFYCVQITSVMLCTLMARVDMLCSSAEVEGAMKPATPRRISIMLKEMMER